MKADLILTNGRVYTVDPTLPWVEAVACHDGRIVAMGRNDDIVALVGPDTQRLDARGRLVLPGLTDAHVHFLAYAIRRHQVSLFGLTNLDSVAEKLQVAVATAEPGQWIQGWGWDDNSWDERPSAAWLDQLAPNNPVALTRMDMHTLWVNSQAMELADIHPGTPDPPESRLDRDEQGRPTGILREWNALALVEPLLPQPDEATLARWVEEAINEANSLGLTGIHDQRVEHEGRQSLRVFQALQRNGRLSVRVHANIAADYLEEVAQLGLQAGFGNDNLWLGHIKSFADGTMGSGTAAMLEPFDGDAENRGFMVTPAGELWSIITRAGESGFPISVHAIGDRAVREVLDVVAEWRTTAPAEWQTTTTAVASRLPMPQRIEHVQLIHPDDLGRLAAHGIVASMQPVHVQSDWPTADRVWGDRARYAYAFHSLLTQGTALAFGSDAPVGPINPLLGIQAAVTRQDISGQPDGGWYPQERLNVEEAIKAYTWGPAHLSGKLDRLGSITTGKRADMVVLERDLFAIPPEEIAETAVAATIFNGRVVYKRE